MESKENEKKTSHMCELVGMDQKEAEELTASVLKTLTVTSEEKEKGIKFVDKIKEVLKTEYKNQNERDLAILVLGKRIAINDVIGKPDILISLLAICGGN